MSHRAYRRVLLAGFSGVAALLMLSSTAFACTWYLGKMTATVTANTTQSVARGGIYNGHPDMGYCVTPTEGGHMTASGTINLVGAADACGTHASTFVANTYNGVAQTFNINWVPGYWNGTGPYNGQDCMTGSTTKGVVTLQSNISGAVDSSGNFNVTTPSFTPSGDHNGDFGICFTDSDATIIKNDAPQVPISVL